MKKNAEIQEKIGKSIFRQGQLGDGFYVVGGQDSDGRQFEPLLGIDKKQAGEAVRYRIRLGQMIDGAGGKGAVIFN